MLKKISLLSIFAMSFVLLASGIAVAQTAPVSGKVELKQADGKFAPLEGALIEIFRVDIKSAGPADKTDKKGQFSFAGLQVGATYAVSVSAPGASPSFLPSIKAGMEGIKFNLEAGDGRRLTPDEVRQLVAQAAGGARELTAEEKKQQAEDAKKRADAEAKNAKITQDNEIIKNSLSAGNDAFGAKNWDLAVAKYDEGINANPTFAGSAPVLMNNKGTALRQRAVETYNKNVKSTDAAAKLEAMGKVKSDLALSVDTYNSSFNILKTAQPADFTTPQLRDEQTLSALNGAKESFRLMAKTEQVDPSKLDIAKILVPEYLAKETDAAKKAEAQTVFGDLYRVTADFDAAIAEYRKALEISNNSPDTLAGLGLSLVNVGIIAKDQGDQAKNKAMSDKGVQQMQEGLNFLGQFTQVAPDTHPLKASVKETTEYLNSQANLTPQKPTNTKKKN